MRTLVYALAGAVMICAQASAGTYLSNAGHTDVRFYWDHAGVSQQSGEWTGVEITVEFDRDDIEATKVAVTIKADSIFTGSSRQEDDMRSERFFDTATHPEITFVSTGVVRTGEKSVRVTGDLTIKGTTKPLTLEVELVHIGDHPVGPFIPTFEGEWLGLRATATILRSDFGVGLGAPLTSDQVRLEIATEMKAQ